MPVEDQAKGCAAEGGRVQKSGRARWRTRDGVDVGKSGAWANAKEQWHFVNAGGACQHKRSFAVVHASGTV